MQDERLTRSKEMDKAPERCGEGGGLSGSKGM